MPESVRILDISKNIPLSSAMSVTFRHGAGKNITVLSLRSSRLRDLPKGLLKSFSFVFVTYYRNWVAHKVRKP